MNYQQFKILVPILFASLASICNADSEENESIKPSEYCECAFYDKPNVNQKLFVGWPGSFEDQTPVVHIEGKKYTDFIKEYEDFRIAINSPGGFFLSRKSGKIEGNLKVISNCIGNYSGICEYVGMAGQIEVLLDGVVKSYKVEGGCGCQES